MSHIEHEEEFIGIMPIGGSNVNLGKENLISNLIKSYSGFPVDSILESKNIKLFSLTYLNSNILLGSNVIQIFPKS